MSFYWQSAVQQQPQAAQTQDEAYWSSINLGGATNYPWQPQQQNQQPQNVPQQPVFHQSHQPAHSNPYEPEPDNSPYLYHNHSTYAEQNQHGYQHMDDASASHPHQQNDNRPQNANHFSTQVQRPLWPEEFKSAEASSFHASMNAFGNDNYYYHNPESEGYRQEPHDQAQAHQPKVEHSEHQQIEITDPSSRYSTTSNGGGIPNEQSEQNWNRFPTYENNTMANANNSTAPFWQPVPDLVHGAEHKNDQQHETFRISSGNSKNGYPENAMPNSISGQTTTTQNSAQVAMEALANESVPEPQPQHQKSQSNFVTNRDLPAQQDSNKHGLRRSSVNSNAPDVTATIAIRIAEEPQDSIQHVNLRLANETVTSNVQTNILRHDHTTEKKMESIPIPPRKESKEPEKEITQSRTIENLKAKSSIPIVDETEDSFHTPASEPNLIYSPNPMYYPTRMRSSESAEIASLLSSHNNQNTRSQKKPSEVTPTTSHPSELRRATESPASISGDQVKKKPIIKSVRDRYRVVKQQYPALMEKFERHRATTPGRLEWNSPKKNIVLIPPQQNLSTNESPGKPSSSKHSSSTPKDETVSPLNYTDISAILRPSSKVDGRMSETRFTGEEQRHRGEMTNNEDMISALRKSRFQRSRNSIDESGGRTRSETGETGPYRGPMLKGTGRHDNYHPVQQQYYHNDGRLSLSGRYYRPSYDPFAMNAIHYDRRRPHSTFDDPAYQLYEASRHAHHQSYDVYRATRPHEEEEEEEETSSTNEEDADEQQEDGDSLDSSRELRQIAAAGQFQSPNYDLSVRAAAGGGVADDAYCYGIIQLAPTMVNYIMCKHPPPPEFGMLNSYERAAYLFYYTIYRKHFEPIGDFKNRFCREFYTYKTGGFSDAMALAEICKHTKREFDVLRAQSHAIAYKASQKHQFSDDRESPESRSLLKMSSNGSDGRMYHFPVVVLQSDQTHELAESDRLSVDSTLKEPMKHERPHAVVAFAPGGRLIRVNPGVSVSVVQMESVADVVGMKNNTRSIINTIEAFKGPLIPGHTPPHTVRLFITSQLDRLMRSRVTGGSHAELSDVLLIWELLEMLVQQKGQVTGPDLARLLMTGYEETDPPFRSRTSSGSGQNKPAPPNNDVVQAQERFTSFLLGGHVEQALESAMRDGLWAEALVLARRVCAEDERRLLEVEQRFLATRPSHNPVMTLIAVASDISAPILTNPEDADMAWRPHAAVLLANLENKPHARATIYQLGRALASRGCEAAADFCFLAVYLLDLKGCSVFQPLSESTTATRGHIDLIHASVSDDVENVHLTRQGWTMLDLQASEVLDYAVRMSGAPSQLSGSMEYQLARLQYAATQVSFGCNANAAFRYCMDIMVAMWQQLMSMPPNRLTQLADMADRLHYLASATPDELVWIAGLKAMAVSQLTASHFHQPQELTQSTAIDPDAVIPPVHGQETLVNNSGQPLNEGSQTLSMVTAPLPSNYEGNNVFEQKNMQMESTMQAANRSRQTSLSEEANQWHQNHQDPINMSQQISTSVAHNRRMSVESTGGTPTTTKKQAMFDMYAHEETGWETEETNSTQPSTNESTPMRQLAPPVHPRVQYMQQKQSMALYDQPVPELKAPTIQPIPMTAQPIQNSQIASISGRSSISPLPEKKQADKRKESMVASLLKPLTRQLRTLTSTNEMILPDDSKKTMTYDHVNKRWVGEGVEDADRVTEPPPVSAPGSASDLMVNNSAQGTLLKTSSSGRLRYRNAFGEPAATVSTDQLPTAKELPALAPPMTTPFWIPTPPDAGDAFNLVSSSAIADPTTNGHPQAAQ